MRNSIWMTMLMLVILASSAWGLSVSLQWDPNTETDLAGYNVYYSSDPSVSANPTSALVGNFTTTTIANLDSSKDWYFAVTAFNTTAVESAYSNIVSVLANCTIIASTGANGTISPIGTRVIAAGGSQTYTFPPDPGYQVSNVIVDNGSVGSPSSYTFPNLSNNHTISVSFSAIPRNIVTTAGANGTVSPLGSIWISNGLSQLVEIKPNSCYKSNVTVDGTSLGSLLSYPFNNVTANHTLSATFSPLTFSINATAGAGGTISLPGYSFAACGSSPTYTFKPNSGYFVSNVLVNGVSVGAPSSYTFPSLNANVTIGVTFSNLGDNYFTWNNSTVSSVWTMDNSGNMLISKDYAHAVGWILKSYVISSDGKGYMLWETPTTACLWTLDSLGNVLTSKNYTRTSTWIPKSYTTSSDGKGYMLWETPTTACLWTLDSLGNVLTSKNYTRTSTWIPKSYTTSSDGKGYMLWDTATSAYLWTMDNTGNMLSSKAYAHGSTPLPQAYTSR
ncbi:MAG: hypothetical protein HGA36_04440 [Candidatus Moranbacteria bacterium]|nr:hypothetical protein [Candidatus Moranbacteria bacterium]